MTRAIVVVLFFSCLAAVSPSPHGGPSHGEHRPSGGHHNHGGSSSDGKPRPPTTGVNVDTRTLDALYQAALKEGGKLVVYAGGDAPGQQDGTKKSFEARFPGVTLDIVVDLSKYHDGRIDYQLKTDSVVFDVAQLQTLQDFPRWKEEGALLNYKPNGWDRIYTQFKDSDGAFTGAFVYAFSNLINTALLPNNSSWPIEAKDWLKPELKGKIAVTYPHDDDAVLFWFKQVTDKYGMDFLTQFKAQNPRMVRGTAASMQLVTSGSFAAGPATPGTLVSTAVTRIILPKVDPFVIWPQRAAIFKKAPHPEAAKLYLSWLVDNQKNATGWSIRDDSIPKDTKSVWSYPNGNPLDFEVFMSDRAQVESFKTQMSLIFGPVEGPSPTGDLGLHPVKSLAH